VPVKQAATPVCGTSAPDHAVMASENASEERSENATEGADGKPGGQDANGEHA